MLSAYFSGFGLGASLIMAIGAQNAFVLIQAIRREHYLLVAATCALLDILLIGAGVLGMGSLVASNAYLRIGVGLGGTLFLGWFGIHSLRMAFSGSKLDIVSNVEKTRPVKQVILSLLAVSLLNPHVYLDTVVMLGSISGNYAENRFVFGFGAMTASVVWFFSLAQGGRLLAPVFARPIAWKVLYCVVCGMVWLVAAGLFYDAFTEILRLFSSQG